MTSILACHLSPDHLGKTVAFFESGRRVCGVLDAYCRHTKTYSLRVSGSWHKECVTLSAEVDVIGVTL